MAAARIVVVTPEPTALTDSYALIKVLATNHKVRDFLVVVNQVENRQEENATFKRLFAACQRFLGVEPVLLGSIRTDRRVPEAIRRQTPYVNAFPDCPASQDIIEIARKLIRIREAMEESLSRRNILQVLPS
jgi:flagellar biosynthesis protein FlhG